MLRPGWGPDGPGNGPPAVDKASLGGWQGGSNSPGFAYGSVDASGQRLHAISQSLAQQQVGARPRNKGDASEGWLVSRKPGVNAAWQRIDVAEFP